MEGGGSKNRLFQILGWEEKAKARHRRDREKEEFPRKVGNRKACGRPWDGNQETHNQTKGSALDICQITKVKDVERTRKQNKTHRMCAFVKAQLIMLGFRGSSNKLLKVRQQNNNKPAIIP